jgi:hypothetical protein
MLPVIPNVRVRDLASDPSGNIPHEYVRDDSGCSLHNHFETASLLHALIHPFTQRVKQYLVPFLNPVRQL